MSRTAEQWYTTLLKCGVAHKECELWAPVFADEIQDNTFTLGDSELDDFLAQILHESSMLTRLTENLNYSSAERIQAVWPSRFPTIEQAQPFVRNPEGLANKVYGGRMGNNLPGDGARFIGRGLIGVTGKDNYTALGTVLKIDLRSNPERLAEPHIALKASIHWWEGNVSDSIMGNIQKITQKVNGGQTGIEHRQQLADRAHDALEGEA